MIVYYITRNAFLLLTHFHPEHREQSRYTAKALSISKFCTNWYRIHYYALTSEQIAIFLSI